MAYLKFSTKTRTLSTGKAGGGGGGYCYHEVRLLTARTTVALTPYDSRLLRLSQIAVPKLWFPLITAPMTVARDAATRAVVT